MNVLDCPQVCLAGCTGPEEHRRLRVSPHLSYVDTVIYPDLLREQLSDVAQQWRHPLERGGFVFGIELVYVYDLTFISTISSIFDQKGFCGRPRVDIPLQCCGE